MKRFKKNKELKEMLDLKPVTDEEFEELLNDLSNKKQEKDRKKKK